MRVCVCLSVGRWVGGSAGVSVSAGESVSRSVGWLVGRSFGRSVVWRSVGRTWNLNSESSNRRC